MNLELYYYESCPFCMKVLRFMSENDIELKLKNTLSDPMAKAELMELGGKTQVPALSIDGRIMYESNDIIDYLMTQFLS
ncbi:MAG: glutathione S-transferase N-terminal domain-containing protein [bacterium]|nr:glutathione S-transferase N-terminal domain-containing protein [bacterium]